MNRVILEENECGPQGGRVVFQCDDRRARHIRNVLRARSGDMLRVGRLNGLAGSATIVADDENGVVLDARLDEPAPEPWLDLILAMPRPKVMHRLWADLAAVGFAHIFIVNAAKVEKYYFDSHWLDEATWRPLLIEGLEQAGATRLPEVQIRRALRPFVEDEIPSLYPNSAKWIAHPRIHDAPPREVSSPHGEHPVIAVGPEGGWTDFELDLFFKAGFEPLSLGDRALRSDTACIALAGALAAINCHQQSSTAVDSHR
jgi:RsmE family RNA methyltransferase